MCCHRVFPLHSLHIWFPPVNSFLNRAARPRGEKFFLRTPGAGAQAGEYRQTTPHLFTGGVHLEKRIHLEKAHAFRCTC